MPVKTERAILIVELENLLRHLILEGDDKSAEFTEIMDIYEAVTGSRYLSDRSTVPKTRALVEILMQFGEREFNSSFMLFSRRVSDGRRRILPTIAC